MEESDLEYVRICGINEVPAGDLKQFNVRGNEILVVNLSGQFSCIDARCTHIGGPLAEGELSGDVITCPWHGSRFNVKSGVVLEGPADRPLKVYRSTIKENSLFVEL